MNKSNTDYHVVIVGAGVAGLTAALVLAQHGLKVAVIEKHHSHRSKMGECIQASVLGMLEKLGLKEQFKHDQHFQLQGYKVHWDAQGLYERNLLASTAGTGWLLNREKFDAMLVNAAEQVGVDIYWQTKVAALHEVGHQASGYQNTWLLDIVGHDNSWQLDVPFVVDATGRSRIITKQLNGVTQKSDNLVACFCRVEHNQCDMLKNQQAVIQSSEHGWWYLAPYCEQYASLCYFTDPDLALPKSTDQLWDLALQQDQLKPYLTGCSVANQHDFKVVPAYSSQLTQCVAHNWVAVGDAACSYDPLSSYGITSAMGSAFYAGKAIVKTFNDQPEFLEVYQSLMHKNYKSYLTTRHSEYQKVTQFNSTFWQRRQAHS